MRGTKFIKKINWELLEEISADYRKLVLREKIKKNLTTIGAISSKIVLVAGVLAGAVVLAAVAPNVIGAVGKLTKRNRKEKIYFNCDQRQFSRALSYLKTRKLIETVQGSNGSGIRLTNKGQRLYKMNLVNNIKIPRSKKWDSRWRLVIFDISEQFKAARDALRQRLNSLGFYQIQKSVFVFPYPCKKEIDFVKEIFGLGYQVRIVEAEYFDGEEEVREYFDL